MEETREIRKVKFYRDRKLWKKEISDLIRTLAYGYNFYYSGCATSRITGDDPKYDEFIEKIKKNGPKHHHKIILYRVYYPAYKDTVYADRYVLAVYKKNTIELHHLNYEYSSSSKYIGRCRTANTFIEAFDEVYKNAVTARQEQECSLAPESSL